MREKKKKKRSEKMRRGKKKETEKRGKRVTLYVRERDVRCALKMDKLMILLLYKEA